MQGLTCSLRKLCLSTALKDTASHEGFHLGVRGAAVALWSFLSWGFDLREWGHCAPLSPQPTERVASKHRETMDGARPALCESLNWVILGSGDRIGACSLTLPITALCQDEGQVDGEGGLPHQPASSLSSSRLHPSLVICLSLPLSVSLFPSVSLYIEYILDIWIDTIHCKDLWKILIIQIFLHYIYIYIYIGCLLICFHSGHLIVLKFLCSESTVATNWKSCVSFNKSYWPSL